MKKIIKIFTVVCLVTILSACNMAQRSNYTFTLENGDDIKIAIKLDNGYKINQEKGTFIINKDNQKISQGIFTTDTSYEEYKKTLQNNETVQNIQTGKHNDNEYIYYETQGKENVEYNYIVKVDKSNSAVIIVCQTNSNDAKDVFERLTIEADADKL